MISYEDGMFALEWLPGAFGFRENGARLTAPDGTLSHGEMKAGDGLIMLASSTPDYRCPKRHRESCEQARKWLVYVNDLERHFTGAKQRVRRFSLTSKRDRLAGDLGQKTAKGIAGSFSRRAEYC
jgi:uncharacterized glyoxalase superfamily protein PhnB